MMDYHFHRAALVLLLVVLASAAQAETCDSIWPAIEDESLLPIEGYSDDEIREALYFKSRRPEPWQIVEGKDGELKYSPHDIQEMRQALVDEYWGASWTQRWQPFPAADLFYRRGFDGSTNLIDFGLGYDWLDEVKRGEAVESWYMGLGLFYHEAGESNLSARTQGALVEFGYQSKLAMSWGGAALYPQFPMWRNPLGIHVDGRWQFGIVRADDQTRNDQDQYGVRIANTAHVSFLGLGSYSQLAVELYPDNTAWQVEIGLKLFLFSFGWRFRDSDIGQRGYFVFGMRATI